MDHRTLAAGRAAGRTRPAYAIATFGRQSRLSGPAEVLSHRGAWIAYAAVVNTFPAGVAAEVFVNLNQVAVRGGGGARAEEQSQCAPLHPVALPADPNRRSFSATTSRIAAVVAAIATSSRSAILPIGQKRV